MTHFIIKNKIEMVIIIILYYNTNIIIHTKMADTKKKLGSLKTKTQGTKSNKQKEEHSEPIDEEIVDEIDEVENDNNEEFDEVPEETEDEPSGIVLEGRVKWFNDRRGYGYITCISSGKFSGSDIFVHHTNVRPQESKYRSLYTNEYVQFYLGQADVAYDEHDHPIDTDYKHQATHVTGIRGGPLLCDGSYRPNNSNSNSNNSPQQRNDRNFRGGSNRGNRRDDEEEEPSHRQNTRPRTTRNFSNEDTRSRPVRRNN